ncbi:translationally-controlled tumor protein [Aspergillus minisclerotigenes]|uniref:Translationally-controlled tumor protein homolog n=1 Tax=Aspergillus minisclerotigenes TaxID=656917 RepID=A0A5N6J052_9EURO|nr:translationally-controlled tumor protein [Aspergillus minisclerotigenes]
MRTFIDIVSGDEVLSDNFPIKEVDDIVYEVDCKFIEFKNHSDDDIEEDTSEKAPNKTFSVIDVVHAFNLQQTEFDKKSYYEHLKSYAPAIEKHLSTTNPDRVPAFKKALEEYVTKIMLQWKYVQCYVGPNLDGMVAILRYREDGVTPYFIFWKDGLRAENR